jgi:hypothetical protein
MQTVNNSVQKVEPMTVLQMVQMVALLVKLVDNLFAQEVREPKHARNVLLIALAMTATHAKLMVDLSPVFAIPTVMQQETLTRFAIPGKAVSQQMHRLRQ